MHTSIPLIDAKRLPQVILAIRLLARRCLFFSAIALGCFALSQTTEAILVSTDTAVGYDALKFEAGGYNNSAFGFDALYNNTTGHDNTAAGYKALYSNTAGTKNTAIGTNALANYDSSFNTATGFEALQGDSSGGATGGYNVADGWQALYSNASGQFNTATGASALHENSTGINNTASGTNALFYNDNGQNNTANGANALQKNVSGNFNTTSGAFGLFNNTSGASNVALGYKAGYNLTIGSGNIIIGANVLGTAGDANTTRIGKSTQAATYISGIYNKTVASGTAVAVFIDSTGKLGTVKSSARYKDDIKPMDKASEAILKLEPVTFKYKRKLDPDGVTQFGLIAEQVEKVNPDLVVREEDGKVSTVRYEAVNAMLLNEFLKAHRKVQEQEGRLEKQEALIAKQQKQIEALTTGLQKVSDRVELRKPSQKLVLTNSDNASQE